MDFVWVLCSPKAPEPQQAFTDEATAERVLALMNTARVKLKMFKVPVWPSTAAPTQALPAAPLIPRRDACEHDWVDDVCRKCGEKL